jgi:hypothetical protein
MKKGFQWGMKLDFGLKTGIKQFQVAFVPIEKKLQTNLTHL